MTATQPASPASPGFLAREDKTCSSCGVTIPKGTPYTWDRSAPGTAYHPDCLASKRAAAPVAAAAPPAAPAAPANGGDVMAGLAAMMLPHIQSQLKSKVDADDVKDIIQGVIDDQFPMMAEAIRNALRNEFTHKTVLEVHNGATGAVVSIENPNPQTAEVLAIVRTRCFNKRLIPYLYGPPGSGKTTIAFQVAKALELPCYVITLNRQSTPSLIIGFVDAHGTYQETEYYKGWKLGGVILIDELDNGTGNLMTTFNSGWANGKMSFPGVGTVDMHEDTVLIGAGNTALRGGSARHGERLKLDDATIDRLVYVEVPYDDAQELALALLDSPGGRTAEWVAYVQAVRKRAATANIDVTISPRASYYGAARLRDGATWEQAITQALARGVAVDIWQRIK